MVKHPAHVFCGCLRNKSRSKTKIILVQYICIMWSNNFWSSLFKFNSSNDNSYIWKSYKIFQNSKGKSLSEAFLFAVHGWKMLCTIIVLNARNNFCTQHVLPRFELGIFMYWTCNEFNEQSVVILWVSWCKKDSGSPAARLRFARLSLARLGLNDGAKLWASYKLCFKIFNCPNSYYMLNQFGS